MAGSITCNQRALILVFVALHINDIVFRKERSNFISNAINPIVVFGAFNNLFAGLTVFRTDQAIVTGDNNAIDFSRFSSTTFSIHLIASGRL